MFGSKKRQDQRRKEAAKAARVAASQRANIPQALQEVLDSPEEITLRVGDTKLRGYRGSCAVSGGDWFGPDWLWHDMESYRRQLGRGYRVVGCAWVSEERIPLSTAMDIASGYSIPRLHAIEHRTKMVKIASVADLEVHRHELHDPDGHWISISRR